MRQILVFTLLLSILWNASACNTQESTTPSAVLKTHVEAMRKNDLAAMRQNLSNGTLEMVKQSAQFQNTSPDEVLKDMIRRANEANQDAAIETRNEQITGDAATVELKNRVTGTWDKIPFIKEDGRWKVALEKLAEEILQQSEGPEK